MSRHRAVRNLDLDEELADADYDYDDDPYESIDPKDRASLDSSYASILDVLGPPESQHNPFGEREIKDALWDAYFDSEAVLTELMKEIEKRNKKKQGLPVDEDESMEDGVSRMSLASPSASGTSGRGGIAGLASRGGRGRGGGRAGMAKRNLASLAPGGLPGTDDGRPFGPRAGDVGARSPANQQIQKEVAENTAGMSKLALLAQRRKAAAAAAAASQPPAALSPSKRSPEAGAANVGSEAGAMAASGSAVALQATDAARPSKLQALAQSRQSQQPTSVPQAASPASHTSDPPTHADGKPLSKLQQKAWAAKQEREKKEAQKRMAASGGQGGEGMDVDGSLSNEISSGANDAPSRLLPGGLPEPSLFPRRKSNLSTLTRRSEVGELLAQSNELQQAGPPTFFSLVAGDEASRAAFVELSPDEKVLKARQGTKLGA